MVYLTDVQWVLAFTAVLVILYLYWATRLPGNFPPGPRRVPLIGNLHIIGQNTKKVHQTVQQLIQEYGPVVGLKLGSCPTIILSGLNVIQEAFVKNSDVFSGRPLNLFYTNKIDRINGKLHGIVFNNGELWKITRRFSLRSLRDFGMGKKTIEERIQEEAEMMCNKLQTFLSHPTDISTVTQAAVSNIICSICFGSRFDYNDPEFIKLINMVRYNLSAPTVFAPVNFLPLLQLFPNKGGLHKAIDNNANIKAFIKRKINQHRQTFTQGQVRDFVDLYLEHELSGGTDKFSIDDIERAIFDLFTAGTETTNTSLRWLLLYMIYHPDVQGKCQQELDQIVGPGRRPCLADRIRMPYVTATIQEMQRLGNIFPLGLPHATTESTELWGYSIPKDTLVIPSLYSVNMDPDYWENPEEFRPERWLGPDGKLERKEYFMPFSVGPRACLGDTMAKNELFLFFSSMLQKFTFRMADPDNPPSVDGSFGVTLAPVPYEVTIVQR